LIPDQCFRGVEREVAANPDASQQALARKIGVSRSTVGRVVRARRAAAAAAE
jgi:DNA-binding XRE family transcriptional regulator